MNHKRSPILVIIILILAVLIGLYFGIRSLQTKGTNTLTASGTIEVVEVIISPKIGGKVTEVMVDEGTSVKIGDMLFRLDDTLLQAQRTLAGASLNLTGVSSMANAALVTAQASYNLALDAARLESAATRTMDWRTTNPTGYSLPSGYFSSAEETNAAQTEVETARSALDTAQNHINTLLADPANTNFVSAETCLLSTRAATIVAQQVLRATNQANNSALHDAAQSVYDAAKTELDDAQSTYDALKNSDLAKQIITSRARLSVAKECYETAQDHLPALQTGENSPKVVTAQAVLHQAQAAVDQAYLAVTQAEDNLALLDVQIGKLKPGMPADVTFGAASK
jgi:HlyD family secretion protein